MILYERKREDERGRAEYAIVLIGNRESGGNTKRVKEKE